MDLITWRNRQKESKVVTGGWACEGEMWSRRLLVFRNVFILVSFVIMLPLKINFFLVQLIDLWTTWASRKFHISLCAISSSTNTRRQLAGVSTSWDWNTQNTHRHPQISTSSLHAPCLWATCIHSPYYVGILLIKMTSNK